MRIRHLLPAAMLLANLPLFSQSNLWSEVNESNLRSAPEKRWIIPQKYRTVGLDVPGLQALLARTPERFNPQNESTVLALPMPDGSFEDFAIVESAILHPELAAKFPDIKTYAGQGIDDPAAAVYLDLTPKGFHAMVLKPGRMFFIDPYFGDDDRHYVCYDRMDYFNEEKAAAFSCETDGVEEVKYIPSENMNPVGGDRSTAVSLRTFDLAMAANGEYTTYHGGTVPAGLAAITTTVNRVRGIYETELAVSLSLVANNDLLVYTNPATDPYSNPPTLAENQTNVDAVIGSANYDIGHAMGTGSGGVATLGTVCNNASKARGRTATTTPIGDPYDIDYVAHEMGHQFGANHTFNGSTGSCSGSNRNASTAYEPGSGSTVMAYAGICGSQNLQRLSNAYFHRVSLNEITTFVTTGTGSTCPATTSSGNNTPTVNADPNGMGGKYIPISTPFELTATGSDVDFDELTFDWEQWDLGPQGAPSSSSTTAPIFRSFSPSASGSRTFPILSDVLDNTGSVGEFLPSVTRDLNFQVTARDNRTVGGGNANGSLLLHVTNTAGPFSILTHNTSSVVNGSILLQWNVANTTTSPVSCANVDILLSTDGGTTFANLVTSTTNDGSQTITLPNTATGEARLKVKCSDNVFFDINNADLRIAPSDATCAEGVTNGDMESATGWTEYSSLGYQLIGAWGVSHGGTGSAWLGYDNNETSRISQTITIPSAAHFAKLAFWYKYDRTDCGSDVFNIKVNGAIVKTYNLCNDAGAADWTRQLIDLSAYIGTAPTIMFECVTNAIYPSDVFVDDVSVYVCEGGSFLPLPVELTGFSAKADGRNAQLKWTTLSESNNSGFEIEMSTEDADFQQVGFVPGAGTTTERHDYHHFVPNLNPGIYYFRLQQIDLDGTVTFSPVKALTIAGETYVSVQPNPANGVAHFVLLLENPENLRLHVLDGQGRAVGTVVEDYFSNGKFKVSFNLNNLPSGTYFFRLSGESLRETGRFSVVK
ncbi:MAG: T9SS type A sorting domain-containing protein [Bacteroidetes bacterium]|nr:T9SS type A sorting domain-containing protein [Bacteroidota bacterium]